MGNTLNSAVNYLTKEEIIYSKKNHKENKVKNNNKCIKNTKSNSLCSKSGINGNPNSNTLVNNYDHTILLLKLQRDKLNAAAQISEKQQIHQKQLAAYYLRLSNDTLKKDGSVSGSNGICDIVDGQRSREDQIYVKNLSHEGSYYRQKALLCLRRARAQRRHIARVSEYLDNIQTMINNVESTQLDNEVFTALAQGGKELQDLNDHLRQSIIESLGGNGRELTLDDMKTSEIAEEVVMENLKVQIENTSEISSYLSQNLTSTDEAEAEAELELLVQKARFAAPIRNREDETNNVQSANGTKNNKVKTQSTVKFDVVFDKIKVPTGEIVNNTNSNDSSNSIKAKMEEKKKDEPTLISA